MIPLQEIKDWLGVTDNASDERLEQLEKRAVALVEARTGKYLGEPMEFTEVLDGNGCERLWLRNLPIGEPVISTRWRLTDAWDSPLVSSDYEIDGRTLSLNSGCWLQGRRNVRVVYTAGIEDADELPLEKSVILELIARDFRSGGNEEVESRKIEDAEIVYRPYKELRDPLSVLGGRPVFA